MVYSVYKYLCINHYDKIHCTDLFRVSAYTLRAKTTSEKMITLSFRLKKSNSLLLDC